MISITKEQLIEFDPCDIDERLKMFGRLKSMNAKQAFKAGFSIYDLCWVAQRLGRKDLLVRFALKCAQSTARLNTDPRVQAALDATQIWINNPTLENQQLCKTAAAAATYAAAATTYATYAAAAAAYAAAAAAYATYAATYATYAAAVDAAYAVYAAAAAAAAADAAAVDAKQKEIEQQKLWFIEIFS